jgi:hypothetical protein
MLYWGLFEAYFEKCFFSVSVFDLDDNSIAEGSRNGFTFVNADEKVHILKNIHNWDFAGTLFFGFPMEV